MTNPGPSSLGQLKMELGLQSALAEPRREWEKEKGDSQGELEKRWPELGKMEPSREKPCVSTTAPLTAIAVHLPILSENLCIWGLLS